jgi:hypothetical protein
MDKEEWNHRIQEKGEKEGDTSTTLDKGTTFLGWSISTRFPI